MKVAKDFHNRFLYEVKEEMEQMKNSMKKEETIQSPN